MRSRLCWIVLPALLLGSISGRAVDEKTVRILFTNNSNGKLVDCNCRNDPYGGLAERVSLVREYRAQHPDLLLLDSGGYLGLSDVDRKGPIVFNLMDIMGYHAWGWVSRSFTGECPASSYSPKAIRKEWSAPP